MIRQEESSGWLRFGHSSVVTAVGAARVAGLPVESLRTLTAPRLVAAVEGVLDGEEELRGRADSLSDRLYVAAGQASGELRGQLVGLRRAVHNLRPPRAREWDDQVRASVGVDLRQDLQQWIGKLGALADAEERLGQAVAEAETAARDGLAALLRDPAFGRAVQRSSASLWAAAQGADLGGAQRRARTARYAGRAAAKTSVRHWFGAWAAGVVDDVEALAWTGPASRWFVREPDLAAFAGWLAEAVEQRACPWARVRPVPGWRADATHIAFVDGSGQCQRLRRVEGVDVALEIAGRRPTRTELIDQLAGRDGDPERAEQFVGRLLQVGVLEALPSPEQGADPLDAVVDGWLAALDSERGPSEEIASWQRLRAVGDVACLEEGEDRAAAPGRRPEESAWEDTVLTGAAVAVPTAAVAAAAPDLARLLPLLGLFDHAIPGRRGLARLCEAVFADQPEVPLLDVYEASLARASVGRGRFYGAEGQAALLSDLRELRDRVLDPGADPSVDVEEVDLDPAVIDDVASRLPADIEAPRWAALHVQLTAESPPRLVVNEASRGGRGAARLLRLLARARDGGAPSTPRPATGQPQWPADELPLDLDALFSSNLNLAAAPETPVLLTPGAEAEPPGDSRPRVDPAELVVRREGDVASLRWPERGVRLRPHPSGMVSELWMPPLPQFVMLCFAQAPRIPPVLVRRGQRALELDDEVCAFPRVALGPGLVLERRTHIVRLDALPLPERQVTAQDLLSLGRFRRHHGIPRRVFARVLDLPGYLEDPVMSDKSRKPLFLDLASPTWVDMLARLARRGQPTHAVFQEALPDPEDSPADPTGSRWVTEVLLELAQG